MKVGGNPINRQRRNGEHAGHEPPVDVVEGEEFDLAFADLPGAGFTWKPGEVPAGLTLLEEQTTPPPATGTVGASQHKLLRFRADRPGEFVLVFTLGRPWEDAPIRTRTVPVHVRTADEDR